MNVDQTDGTGSGDKLSQENVNPSADLLSAAVQAATSLCLASEHFTQRLGEIEDQIEEACNIDAVRVMRFRLTEYLQQLRDQTLHPREKMAEGLAQLRDQLEIAQGVKSSKAAHVPAAADTLTGLQARGCAERALAAAIDAGVPAYAALFVVDRLHLINSRYGYSTGDQMLRAVCDQLAACLSPGDRFFRWTGPAFVVLMERVESGAEIQKEINHMGLAKLNVTVQIGNGSVLLPIPTLPLLVPLTGLAGLPDLTRRMDAFIGEQARH
ncbi:MAG: GGDEF domain-containing protein [Acidobacteriia bacterium]|nr:GGDEF domain-containing protein [Terriglobia bacterium]